MSASSSKGSEHAGFLALTGTATISTDKKKIKELWEPIVGTLIAGARMLVGAAIGKTLDDSMEGRARPEPDSGYLAGVRHSAFQSLANSAPTGAGGLPISVVLPFSKTVP